MSSPSKSELAGGRISPKPLSTSTGRISPRRPSSRSGNPLKKSTSSSPVTFLESETLTNSQSSAYARRVRELSESSKIWNLVHVPAKKTQRWRKVRAGTTTVVAKQNSRELERKMSRSSDNLESAVKALLTQSEQEEDDVGTRSNPEYFVSPSESLSEIDITVANLKKQLRMSPKFKIVRTVSEPIPENTIPRPKPFNEQLTFSPPNPLRASQSLGSGSSAFVKVVRKPVSLALTSDRTDIYNDISNDLNVQSNPLYKVKIPKKEREIHSESGILYYEEGKSEPKVRRGTLDFLLKLTREDIVDSNPSFVDTLLTTHPLFIDSVSFSQRLIDLYNHGSDEKQKSRIIKVITRWLEYDLDIGNDTIIKKILSFAESLLHKGDQDKPNGKLLYRFCLKTNDNFPVEPSKALPRLSKGIKPTQTPTFLEIDVTVFAEHLTACDWDIFKRVKCTELLNNAWTKPGKEETSPHMLQLVNRFNFISTWVASEILMCGNESERVKVLEKFIGLAVALRSLQNFHSMIAVYSALNMHSIQRLSRTWKNVSKRSIGMIKSLEIMVDGQNNWKEYRNIILTTTPPLIPFEGIFFSDFLMIHENEDQVNSLINFEKITLFGTVLQSIKRCQQVPFMIQSNKYIETYLQSVPQLDEDQLWNLSSKVSADQLKKKSILDHLRDSIRSSV